MNEPAANPNAPIPPAPEELDARDEALLEEVGVALRAERQGIAADGAAFRARLLARVEQLAAVETAGSVDTATDTDTAGAGAVAPVAPAARASTRRVGSGRTSRVIRPRSWTYTLKYYVAAAVLIGLTLGLFAMSGILSRPGANPDFGDIRAERITADRIPLSLDGESIDSADLLKKFDHQKLKVVLDAPDGEACLALIPQAEIDKSYNDLQKKQLAARPNWEVTVEQGRVTLPVEAYTKALGATRTGLLLLKVGGHFEIWTAEAFQRYVNRTQKLPPGVSVAPDEVPIQHS
ncbi:MAG: hypothetical protein ACREJ2_08780 [Planctomycetota bacterium]